jgi:hypothetical protein
VKSNQARYTAPNKKNVKKISTSIHLFEILYTGSNTNKQGMATATGVQLSIKFWKHGYRDAMKA